MRVDGKLDGHIVQGHVDQTAVCTGLSEADSANRRRPLIRRIPAR